MMVLLRRKGSSYSKFPADDEHANVVQQLNSLSHLSSSGCCPNNLSSLKLRNQFIPGFHLCFQEADCEGCDRFSICMLPCLIVLRFKSCSAAWTWEHHVYVLLLLMSLSCDLSDFWPWKRRNFLCFGFSAGIRLHCDISSCEDLLPGSHAENRQKPQRFNMHLFPLCSLSYSGTNSKHWHLINTVFLSEMMQTELNSAVWFPCVASHL